ncbi:unnamed protein product, partial [Didymodactylos carnosus]
MRKPGTKHNFAQKLAIFFHNDKRAQYATTWTFGEKTK